MRGKLSDKPGARGKGRSIICCLPEARARNRVQSALRGHESALWVDSFAEVHEAVRNAAAGATVVIGLHDARGATALGIAQTLRTEVTGTAIVVCCSLHAGNQQPISELAAAGVHDILFTGVNDDAHMARMVIFGASLGGAADVVMQAVTPTIPEALIRFVDLAVRRPRDLRRVSDVALALNVPRQTLGRWCRANDYVGPEELLVWARLFLVAVMLETSERTLESIANEMHYGSPTALRNRIRNYSGLTSTQLREGGVQLLLEVFQRRIADVRKSRQLVSSR